MAGLIARSPLTAFFLLAYGVSWTSCWLLGGPGLFPFGPFIAALVMATASGGMAGLGRLLERCLRWRLGVRWYAVAFLVPVLLAAAAASLTVLPGIHSGGGLRLAPWQAALAALPLALIDAPLWEETGWRGFALPRFPARRSRLTNTLALGILVAGWHLPIALSEPALAAPYLIATVASAVVLNWVYYHARESALIAIVFHSVQNAAGGFYLFKPFAGPDLVRLWWLFAGLYALLAVVLVACGAFRAYRPR